MTESASDIRATPIETLPAVFDRWIGAFRRNKEVVLAKKPAASSYAATVRRMNSGLVAAAVISCITNLLTFSSPIFVIEIYDRVLSGRSAETLVGLLIIIVVLHAFSNLIQALGRRALSALGDSVESDLEASAFLAFHTASLQANANVRLDPLKALEELRRFASMRSGISGLFDAPWCLIYIAFLGLLHPSMGVLGLVCCIAVAAISWRVAVLQLRLTQGQASAARRWLLGPVDHTSGLIGARGMTDLFKRRWLVRRKSNRTAMRTDENIIRVYQTTANFLLACAASGMMALAAYLTIRQLTTAGAILTSSVLLRPTLKIAQAAPIAFLSLRRVRLAKQALKHWIGQPQKQLRFAIDQENINCLVVKGVSVCAPGDKKRLLGEVSFSVKAGTVLCITGDSGSGKSALCNVICGVWPQDGGEILINGLPVSMINSSFRSNCVGYLSESGELLKASIAENISRTKSPPDYDAVRSASQRFQADEHILALEDGYDTIVDEMRVKLSRGLRQRIGLSGAFFADPSILVLDHPMAYCDERCRQVIVDEVLKLRTKSRIVIIVAYTAEELALGDAFLSLKQGRVASFKPSVTETTSVVAPEEVAL